MQLDIGVMYIGLENCAVLCYYVTTCVNNTEGRGSVLLRNDLC